MRFFEKILKKFAKNEYIITESEIEEQLNAYDEYKQANIEESVIKINRNYQFDEIINQVSDQIYKDNKYQDYRYNEYNSEEDIWTSLKAS